MGQVKSILRQIAILPIKGYRYFLSPFFGMNCRFQPSCSNYASECIITHGIIKGFFLTLLRLLRCHPWARGGFDPVPECREK